MKKMLKNKMFLLGVIVVAGVADFFLPQLNVVSASEGILEAIQIVAAYLAIK